MLWRQPAYAAAAPVKHVHLTYGANASRSMTVNWMTPAPVAKPFVQVDGTRIVAVTRQYDGYPGYFHAVRLKGLHAVTSYPYSVGHAGQVATSGKLDTGPIGRTKFTFTAFGDQGYSNGPLNGNNARANTELARRFDPALHAIVGDLAYANGDQSIWDDWFSMISPAARRRPWMPCIGNHEVETQFDPLGQVQDTWGQYGYDPYRTRFDLPDNNIDGLAGCFYAFRYGSVQFISIDNNDVTLDDVPWNRGYTGGKQAAWLEKTLARAAADPTVDFIIVLMHQSAFSSSSKHGSDIGVRRAWFDLFSRYQVDLVLQGHDHTYERSHAMRGTTITDRTAPYRTDAGTVYVVCGNGGSTQEPFKPGQPSWSAFRKAFVIGTLRVDVDPFGTRGRCRLTLGDYAAATGKPIEEGIVLERPYRHPRSAVGQQRSADETSETLGVQSGAADRKADRVEALPNTGGPAAIAAVAAAAAGATALTKITVGRLRDPDDTAD